MMPEPCRVGTVRYETKEKVRTGTSTRKNVMAKLSGTRTIHIQRGARTQLSLYQEMYGTGNIDEEHTQDVVKKESTIQRY